MGRRWRLDDNAADDDSWHDDDPWHDGSARDRMLDTMPGGEMARGDSAVSMQLLKKKM